MFRLIAFRCDYFTPHGQLLELSDADVNASYFEFAQIYLLRSERHGPMYFDSPLFCDGSPAGFRSTISKSLLPHQYRASDHLAAKSRAIVMAQLKCWRWAGQREFAARARAGDRQENAGRSRCPCRRFLQSDQDRQSTCGRLQTSSPSPRWGRMLYPQRPC